MSWVEVAGDTSDTERRLGEILQALWSITAAKGVAADLRVTVLNPTGTAVTISSGTVTTVTSVTNPLARTVLDIQNQNNLTAQNFTANVTRP